MRKSNLWAGLLAVVLAIAIVGCGGSDGPTGSPSPSPSPSPAPTPSPSPGGGVTGGTTITITSAGVSPKTLTVAIGSRVTFVNNDNRPHDMNSNPHPEHTDCPALNVGFLAAGEMRTGQNLTTIRTCGFHDHNQPDVTALQGTIVIVQ